ncbi:MAG TPA: hypothetical protein VF407_12445 [Polyangiaceae bacterium]
MRHPYAVFALVSLAVIACGRKNKPNFDGTYDGKSTMAITMKMPDGTVDKGDDDDKKPIDDTYRIADDDQAEIKLTVLDDTDHCVLTATRSGASATVKPGQSCTTKNDSDSMTLKVTKGTVTMAGDEATIDVTFDTSTTVESTTVPGTMDLHFVGKRS